ncbi:hypothetical protein WCWAEYFT_CDS0250 [Vibrio phage VB_VaC_TDDLMA]
MENEKFTEEQVQKLLALLNEDTTGPAAPEIATTDENLSLDKIFQQTDLPSLGRQIFSVLPMTGPTAAIFNIKTDKTNPSDKKAVLLRNEVEVYPSESISTGITQEVVQDIRAQYGMFADQIIGKLLRGLANDQENTRTLEFLDAQSLAVQDLQLSDSLNAEVNLFEVTQKVHESVLKMNNKNFRTYEAFAVIPATALGGILGLTQYAGGEEDDRDNLLVTVIGKTKFYLNPDPTSTTAYVGLKDTRNPSRSSAVFSPYMSNIVEATDPDNGNINYHLYNRFAITASPLHETDNEMLYKFNILV